jgi:hypothetical protein
MGQAFKLLLDARSKIKINLVIYQFINFIKIKLINQLRRPDNQFTLRLMWELRQTSI